MRHQSMLVVGLAAALLSVPPARTAIASTGKAVKQKASTTVHRGIETQRVEDGVIETDITGKGAVLCIWGLYGAVRAVGQECHKGEDIPFQSELDRSLDLIDKFIAKNGPSKKSDIEARRAKGLEELRASGNICVGDPSKMYDLIRKRGPAALHAATVDLLSIPRKPVMNPCF